jgi:hypothetical protein
VAKNSNKYNCVFYGGGMGGSRYVAVDIDCRQARMRHLVSKREANKDVEKPHERWGDIVKLG